MSNVPMVHVRTYWRFRLNRGEHVCEPLLIILTDNEQRWLCQKCQIESNFIDISNVFLKSFLIFLIIPISIK